MLKEKLASYEERISKLERRDTPITVHEAMRILERYICLESAGSKTMFLTKFFNIDRIKNSGDKTVIANFQIVLGKLRLTTDHLDYLSSLKDNGDFATHNNRPQMSKAEWYAIHMDDAMCNDEVDDIDISMLWKGLIDSLATYIPPPDDPSEPWVILDPVAKSKKAISTPKSSTATSTDGSTASTPTPFGK